VELLVDRRNVSRRNEPTPAVGAALGLVLSSDQRSIDRRHQLRRRSDPHSIAEMLSAVEAESLVKTFAVGGSRARKSALFECGCVVVDPVAADAQLQVLECPTHASLQGKLRRRQTDRH
jgi:hypothetical protein